MGMNYYATKKPCAACGNADAPLHIGKSSYGWCFSLHVVPEAGMNSLTDWVRVLTGTGYVIVDESNAEIPFEELLVCIVARRGSKDADKDGWWRASGYESEADFYEKNHAVPGPNGLVRHRIDRTHCVGHGAGPWDLITGEFS